MLPWNIVDALSPNARVGTAVIPFVAAMALRLLVGKNRFTATFISLTITWFAANILMAPYSSRMRADIFTLRSMFR